MYITRDGLVIHPAHSRLKVAIEAETNGHEALSDELFENAIDAEKAVPTRRSTDPITFKTSSYYFGGNPDRPRFDILNGPTSLDDAIAVTQTVGLAVVAIAQSIEKRNSASEDTNQMLPSEIAESARIADAVGTMISCADEMPSGIGAVNVDPSAAYESVELFVPLDPSTEEDIATVKEPAHYLPSAGCSIPAPVPSAGYPASYEDILARQANEEGEDAKGPLDRN